MSNLPQNTRQHKNQAVLAGLIARDPAVKFTSGGKKLCSSSICTAVTAKSKTFVRITAWEEMSDILEQRKTGDFIEVTGRIQSRTWNDASGQKRSITELVINNIASSDAVRSVPVEAGAGESIDVLPF